MKPSSVSKAVNHLTDVGRPAMLWGMPGVGKSEIMDSVAKHRGVEIRDVRLSLLDPTDIKGFPVPDVKAKVMRWLPADFLPTKGEGILFFDELPNAPAAVQSAALQLVLTGQIGEYKLPPGWSVHAAGNRTTDRAGAHAMLSSLANRFVHVDVEIDLIDWCEWARNAGVHTDVIAFLRFRPNLMHTFDAASNARTFASPRTWKFLSDSYHQRHTIPKDVALQVYQGIVGDGAAGEFKAFADIIKDLPTIDEVKLNPKKIPVPDKPATLYALTTALAAAANSNNMDILMQFMSRVSPEFQVLFMKDAVSRDTTITKTRSFTEWSEKHADVLL